MKAILIIMIKVTRLLIIFWLVIIKEVESSALYKRWAKLNIQELVNYLRTF